MAKKTPLETDLHAVLQKKVSEKRAGAETAKERRENAAPSIKD